MKQFLPLALVTAAAITTASADLTIAYSIEQGSGTKPSTLTLKTKDGKVRSDVSEEVSAIVDTQTGDTVTLMHQQKMATTLPGSTIKDMAAAAGAGNATANPAPPKPTGRTEKISGFQCEEYVVENGGQTMELWITKEVPEGSDIISQLSRLGASMNPAAAATEGMTIDGFPVRTSVSGGPQGRVTITVVGINRDPLKDSEFKVPSGYRKVEVPQIP